MPKITGIGKRGKIKSLEGLRRWGIEGNLIIVHWTDKSYPSVLRFNGTSWADKEGDGYSIDLKSYPVYAALSEPE